VMKLLRGATTYWPLHLPFVQYAYNDKVQSLTGSSPFVLMFNRQPNAAKRYELDINHDEPCDYDEWKKHQLEVLSLVFPAINKRIDTQQQKYRAYLDQIRAKLIAKELSVGVRVMIKDPRYLLQPGMKPSSAPKYVGPYTVVRKTKYGTYILRDMKGELLERSVPIDQIKTSAPTFTDTDKKIQDAPIVVTAPAASDSDKDAMPVEAPSVPTSAGSDKRKAKAELEPERILNSKFDGQGLKYLVKWKHKHASSASWVRASVIEDSARHLIEEYFKDKDKDSVYDQRDKRFTRSSIRTVRVHGGELTVLLQ